MFKFLNCNGRRGHKGRPSSWRWIRIEGLGSFRRDGASDAPFPSFGDIYRTGDLAARGAGCAERVLHSETNMDCELAKKKRGSKTLICTREESTHSRCPVLQTERHPRERWEQEGGRTGGSMETRTDTHRAERLAVATKVKRRKQQDKSFPSAVRRWSRFPW